MFNKGSLQLTGFSYLRGTNFFIIKAPTLECIADVVGW